MERKNHKKEAEEFLLLCASGDSEKAFKKYASPGFRHHNAYFKGDALTLMKAMAESAKMNPDKIFEIKQIIGDDDRVAIHSHIRQEPESRGMAVIHIFRFDGDKIAEMWDFGQMLPELIINENGMF